MKMPEKHDLLAAILAAKEQGIGAILAFAMAYLRGRYNGGAFTAPANWLHHAAQHRSNHRHSPICRICQQSVYNERFIGYIGTDSIGSFIKRFAAKKPE